MWLLLDSFSSTIALTDSHFIFFLSPQLLMIWMLWWKVICLHFGIKISYCALPAGSQIPTLCVCVCAPLCTCVHFSDGCPGLCSGHGRCTLEQSGWRCVCQAGWSGPGCSVVMETDCSDGTDNDGGDILTSSIIFYLFLSVVPLSLSVFLSRLSIPFHYSSSCYSCRKICLIVPPLHPSVLSQSCWDYRRVLLVIIILNMYLCVRVCAYVRVSMPVFFPLITAKCLICIPPARIKGTQWIFQKFKYSKPCRIDFWLLWLWSVWWQVRGVCVWLAQPHGCVFLSSYEETRKQHFSINEDAAHYNHFLTVTSAAPLQYITSFKNNVQHYIVFICAHSLWNSNQISFMDMPVKPLL